MSELTEHAAKHILHQPKRRTTMIYTSDQVVDAMLITETLCNLAREPDPPQGSAAAHLQKMQEQGGFTGVLEWAADNLLPYVRYAYEAAEPTLQDAVPFDLEFVPACVERMLEVMAEQEVDGLTVDECYRVGKRVALELMPTNVKLASSPDEGTEQYVIVCGSPFEGMTVLGTFSDAEEASEYAQGTYEIKNSDWWVVLLEPKQDD